MSGRFAFVSPEGDANSFDWDGSASSNETARTLVLRDEPALVGQAGSRPLGFSGLTWSPDGRWIAASVLYHASPQQPAATLVLLDVSGQRQPRLVYEGTPGLEASIAPGIPHYVNWSPAGDRLAVLAQTAGGMAVLMIDATGSAPPLALLTGAPLFTAWSPQGSHLLIHRGSELFLIDVHAPADLRIIARGATAFQVPAWSPDGERFAYVRRAGAGSVLVVSDLAGKETAVFESSFGFAALAWLAARNEILFSPLQNARPARFRGLWLVDPRSERREQVLDEALVLFDVSPDGSSVAYLTPTLGHRRFNWNVLNLTSRAIVRFRVYPAPEFSLAVSFFEQYALSHRLWSADGAAFLVNGRILENGTPPDLAPNTIYVQPALPGVHAVAVTKGSQVSWSPV